MTDSGVSAGRAGTLAGAGRARKGWGLPAGEADPILAGARRALVVMVGFLALIWLIQLVNWADHYQLTLDYGIRPRAAGSLPDLLTAPFLHVSWAHIEANSGPLFIFGFLAAYRGIWKFLGVTALVIITSGLGAWLTAAPHMVGVGASGVVFGYFGYLMVRGFFDRRVIDMLIGAVMALCFAYQFAVLLPHAGIGWQAHIGGLIGGLLAGWVFRDRRVTSGVAETTAGLTGVAETTPGLTGGAAETTAGLTGGTATTAVDRSALLRQIDEMGI